VIIGTEALTPAMGCSTIADVMPVMLPPVFWGHPHRPTGKPGDENLVKT